jgi:hypothetical protein
VERVVVAVQSVQVGRLWSRLRDGHGIGLFVLWRREVLGRRACSPFHQIISGRAKGTLRSTKVAAADKEDGANDFGVHLAGALLDEHDLALHHGSSLAFVVDPNHLKSLVRRGSP